MIKFRKQIVNEVNGIVTITLHLEINWNDLKKTNPSIEKDFFGELKSCDAICEPESPNFYRLQNFGILDFAIRLKHFFIKNGLNEFQWLKIIGSINTPGWESKCKLLALYPLHLAVLLDRFADVEFLIKQGFPMDTETNNEQLYPFPLFIAATRGNIDIATLLIKHKANPSQVVSRGCYEGLTPLTTAIIDKHIDMAKLLLAAGADFKSPVQYGKNKGHTPLLIAAAEGCTEIAALLLNNGADYTTPMLHGPSAGCTIFFTAIAYGHVKLVELLMTRYGINVHTPIAFGSCEGYTPLCVAMEEENIEILKMLLMNNDIDLEAPLPAGNYADLTPLCAAIIAGNLEMTRMLLRLRANVNTPIADGPYKGFTPLCLAIKENKGIDFIELLLRYRAHINQRLLNGSSKGYKAFLIATFKKKPAILELLLKNGADPCAMVSTGPQQGMTPLIIAALQGSEEVVSYLLDRVSRMKIVESILNVTITPPFIHQLAVEATNPHNQAHRNILRVLISICPKAREINHQGKNLYAFYKTNPELQSYIETELDGVICRKVVDVLDILISLIEGSLRYPNSLVMIVDHNNYQEEKPVKNLGELILAKLEILCSFYEISKIYNCNYYYVIKNKINHAKAVVTANEKGISDFIKPKREGKEDKMPSGKHNSLGSFSIRSVPPEKTQEVIAIINDMCKLVTQIYQAFKGNDHQHTEPITRIEDHGEANVLPGMQKSIKGYFFAS